MVPPSAQNLDNSKSNNISEDPSTPGLTTTDSNIKGVNWRTCLYGLDTDDEEKSSMTRNQQNDQNRSSLSLPPPPNDLDVNNNNRIESDNYTELYELVSKEDNLTFNHRASNPNLTVNTLPTPPTFLNHSTNSQATTLTPAGLSINDILCKEEPTKDTTPAVPVNAHSSSSSFNTVIQNHANIFNNNNNNKLKLNRLDLEKHWKNLAYETLPCVSTPITTSLMPEHSANRDAKQQQLDKHLNGTKTINTSNNDNKKCADDVLYKSCPNIMKETFETMTHHEYQNEQFESGVQDFKLDHLLDINPKRLAQGSKFRCRIHDVIDEWGRFWIEVIYSKEEEEKFQKIFKLFRLCSRS